MFAPYNVMKCKDGWYAIGTTTDKGWIEFCADAGLPELAQDERFATNALRCHNSDVLYQSIEPFFLSHTKGDLEAMFRCDDFAATPVIGTDETLAHPHIHQRDMVLTMDDPNVGMYQGVGLPIKFEKTKCSVYRGSPRLGQDTLRILQELGYTSEMVQELAKNDVVDI